MISPYKDYNSVFRWQTNIFVHMPLWNCFTEGMMWFLECWLILLLMTLFCCLWSCRTIRACGCLLCCLWNFWLFVITVRTLSGFENTNCPWKEFSEKPMIEMWWVWKYHWSMRDLIYPSSAGTLTHVKPLAMFESVFCHRVRTIHISKLLFWFWWGRLGRVEFYQVT
jgi:hypothetical protein